MQRKSAEEFTLHGKKHVLSIVGRGVGVMVGGADVPVVKKTALLFLVGSGVGLMNVGDTTCESETGSDMPVGSTEVAIAGVVGLTVMITLLVPGEMMSQTQKSLRVRHWLPITEVLSEQDSQMISLTLIEYTALQFRISLHLHARLIFFSKQGNSQSLSTGGNTGVGCKGIAMELSITMLAELPAVGESVSDVGKTVLAVVTANMKVDACT